MTETLNNSGARWAAQVRNTAAIARELDATVLAREVRHQVEHGWRIGAQDDDTLHFPGEVVVDPDTGEVYDGLSTRTPQEQLNFALIHLAAALTAGAKL